MPYCDDKEIIFLHIPKTGGTIIKRIFNIQLFDDSNPATNPSPQHLTCEMLRQRIGKTKYDHYYKFVFVRNPWARILSSYFWRQTLPKKRPVIPFIDFIASVEQVVNEQQFYNQEFGDHFIPQTHYTDNVDDIFRFENLREDIKKVASKLDFPTMSVPPKTPKHYDKYWEFYNNETRNIISSTYAEEIELFGYEFGQEH